MATKKLSYQGNFYHVNCILSIFDTETPYAKGEGDNLSETRINCRITLNEVKSHFEKLGIDPDPILESIIWDEEYDINNEINYVNDTQIVVGLNGL